MNPSDIPSDVDGLLNLGRQRVLAGESDQAIRLLRRAIARDADNVDVRYWLGRAYRQEGMLGPARVQFQIATRRAPGHADAWCALGNVLRAKRSYAEAEQAFQSALRADPKHLPATTSIGALYADWGDWPRAAQAYRNALRIEHDDADVLCDLAIALKQLGDLESAQDECEAALDVNPSHGRARTLLNELGAAHGRPTLGLCMTAHDGAASLREGAKPIRDCFDQIVIGDAASTDETRDAAAQIGAEVVQVQWTGDFSAVRNAALERATTDWVLWLEPEDRIDRAALAAIRRALPPEPTVAFELHVLTTGRPALEYRQVRVVPRLPGIRFEGRVCERLEDAVERAGLAVQTLDAQVTRLACVDGAALQLRHDLLLKQVQDHPDDLVSRLHLVRSLCAFGQTPLAIACAHDLVALQPASARDRAAWLYAHILLGELAQSRGEMAAALDAFRRALDAEQGYMPGEVRLGVLLASQGQHARAIPLLTAGLNAAPALSSVPIPWDALRLQGYLALGVCAEGQDDTETAEACFRRALELDSDNADACIRLARLRARCGARGEAVALYQRAERVRPDRADVPLGLGNVYFAAGEMESARTHYARAMEIAPDWPDSHFNASAAAYEQGRLDDALALCEKAMQLGMDTPLAHRSYARNLARVGRWDEALREYRIALDRDPGGGHAEVWEGLEAALRDGRSEEGIRLCELLVEHGEETPAVFCCMGDLYLKLGSIDAARTAYQAAIDRDSGYQPALERMNALASVSA